MKYTVSGFFEDTQQITCFHTEAKDATGAVANMKRSRYHKNQQDNVMIVGVFEGCHVDMNECESVSALQDWPD